MNIEAIIFDCDGTLVDSEILGNEALVQYVREFGLDLSLEDSLSRFAGRRMSDIVVELQRELGRTLPDDFVSNLRARMATAFEARLQPVEGARELLASLKQPMCVATNGPREKMEHILTLTGLSQFFKGRLFSAYDIERWKPDPELFLHAAREMDVEPACCMVVEDSIHGIRAGVSAGMQVVALRRNGSTVDIPVGVRSIGHLSKVLELL